MDGRGMEIRGYRKNQTLSTRMRPTLLAARYTWVTAYPAWYRISNTIPAPKQTKWAKQNCDALFNLKYFSIMLSDSDLPILRQTRNHAPRTTRQFFLTSSCWNHLYTLFSHNSVSNKLSPCSSVGRSLKFAFADGSQTHRIWKIRVVCMWRPHKEDFDQLLPPPFPIFLPTRCILTYSTPALP
jgi:hypothetical protein